MASIARIELKKVVDVKVINGKFEKDECTKGVDVYFCTDSISAWIGSVTDIDELDNLVDPRTIKAEIDAQVSCDELEVIEAVIVSNQGKFKNYDGCISTMNLSYIEKLESSPYSTDIEELADFLKDTDKEVILKKGKKEYFVGFGLGCEDNIYGMVCFRRDYDLNKIGCKPIRASHLAYLLELQLETEGEKDIQIEGIEFSCVDNKAITESNYFDNQKDCIGLSIDGVYETDKEFIITLH